MERSASVKALCNSLTIRVCLQISLVFFFAIALLLPQTAAYGTVVSGDVLADTTWGPGEVRELTEDVSIKRGATLTIAEGSTVVGNGHSIIVYGSLEVEGASLSGVSVSTGSTGEYTCSVVMRNSSMSGGSLLNPTGGGAHVALLLEGNTFRGLGGYTYVWYPEGEVEIRGNVFEGCGGISVGSDHDVRIANNVFYGMTTPYAVRDWAQYGGSQCYVEGNSFYDAGTVLDLDLGNASMVAVGNYWNTQNESYIRGRISDAVTDLSQTGVVDFYPWLSEPAPETPAVDYEVPESSYAAGAVVPKPDIAYASIVVEDQTYTGNAVIPNCVVRFGKTALVFNVDYTLSAVSNIDAGEATLRVTGKGKYFGLKEAVFKINPADIQNASVGSIASQQYTGKAITPSLRVTASGKTLKEGYDFDANYSDNTEPGIATITILGKGNYTGKKSITFSIASITKVFPDVTKGAWYYDVVSRATSLSLISGYGNGTFGPNNFITRGQVAVILWHMAGSPKKGSRVFPDVRQSDYFYLAVKWAGTAGVVNGNADGTFRPNDNVTREQLAVMLANYARRVAKKRVTGSSADYSSMKDAYYVSSYAQSAMGWCFRNKIMSGSNGNILAKGNATRAQAAKMLVGLYDLTNVS